MKKMRIVIIPEGAHEARQFHIPTYFIKFGMILILAGASALTFLLLDYLDLLDVKTTYERIARENDGMKGEARLLMANLDQVKASLEKVETYSVKLQDLTNLQFKNFSKQTGIGPLTDDEYKKHIDHQIATETQTYLPAGIHLEKLTFRPVFDRLSELEHSANKNSIKLQQLLSELGEKKSLLSSIPSMAPVNGWLTSSFGARVSPFTGEKGGHQGIDLASPIGTPIAAPGDGVVIFSGAKEGFGNFIMIAHGNGIVSRFGHNAENMVQPGQKVKRGDQIGTVGMTGRTTGPHLHYEILVDGVNVNPKRFILNM